MEISLSSIGSVHVISLRGKFNLGPAVDEFKSTTDTLMKGGNARFVVVLAEVPSMDSSAIGALVRLIATSKKSGGDVKLVNPSKMVVQTLKIVGLLNLFSLYDSEQAAAAAFSTAAGIS